MQERYARLRQIRRLDPEKDFLAIYRLSTVYEFPWDFTRALELALYRTYAVPSIGRLLSRTPRLRPCTTAPWGGTWASKAFPVATKSSPSALTPTKRPTPLQGVGPARGVAARSSGTSAAAAHSPALRPPEP